jgi:hypothetical protein
MKWPFLAKNHVCLQQKNFQLFPINRTVLAINFQEIPAPFAAINLHPRV